MLLHHLHLIQYSRTASSNTYHSALSLSISIHYLPSSLSSTHSLSVIFSWFIHEPLGIHNKRLVVLAYLVVVPLLCSVDPLGLIWFLCCALHSIATYKLIIAYWAPPSLSLPALSSCRFVPICMPYHVVCEKWPHQLMFVERMGSVVFVYWNLWDIWKIFISWLN